MSNCKAKQASDQMFCECGNVWDMNDPSRPRCQYAVDVGMPEYVCANECQYALNLGDTEMMPPNFQLKQLAALAVVTGAIIGGTLVWLVPIIWRWM